MRWPWQKRPTAKWGRKESTKMTMFCPDQIASVEHGLHCNGIAVGHAVDRDVKMVVLTLTIGESPVATLAMPHDAADAVAASLLKASSGGLVQ